jgi:predicted nucleic acid-binding protein
VILVDSDILINHLRGHQSATDWLRATQDHADLALSAVSVLEVAGGMRSPERHDVVRLIAQCAVLPITERIAWQAADFMRAYRRSHSGISQGDYVLAATARVHGLDLATLNVRHFPMISGLTRPFEP